MVRKLITVMGMVMALLAMPIAASASTSEGNPVPAATGTQYPAPPVTQSVEVLDTVTTEYPPTSTDKAAVAQHESSIPSAPDTNDLAYTGVSFNVWLVAIVALALLACGVVFIVAGGRLVRRRHRRHA